MPTGAVTKGAVRRSVRNGVTVLSAPSDGPLTVSLAFRVGQADETLATRGISHAVEHLALHQAGQAPHWFNGATGQTTTSFVARGTAAEVREHLEGVCAALADLDTQRLERERTVLASEEAQAGGAATASLYSMRFGARGFGLVGYDELGMKRLTGEDLAHWARTRFTAANAVLAVEGSVPRGLKLPLPAGESLAPLPDATPMTATPTAYGYSERGVGLSFLLTADPASGALASILARRLQDHVRHDLGLSYGVRATSDLLRPGTSHHLLWLDALPENARAVQDAVVQVLRGLIEEPGTKAEVAQLVARAKKAPDETSGEQAFGGQFRLLHGLTSVGLESARKLTPAALAAPLAALRSTLLVAAPEPRGIPGDLARPLRDWSDDRVEGRTFLQVDGFGGNEATLVLGTEGASRVAAKDRAGVAKPVTVPYGACAAVAAYDDGSLTLLGEDGFALPVRAEEWVDFASVSEELRAALDPGLFVPMGGRTPVAAKPKPVPPAPAPKPPRRVALSTETALVLLVIVIVIGAIVAAAEGAYAALPGAAGITVGVVRVIERRRRRR